MFGLIHALLQSCKDIYLAIPENRELKDAMKQKDGYIKALNDSVKHKEATISAITDEASDLKDLLAKLHADHEAAQKHIARYKGLFEKANGNTSLANKSIRRLNQQVASLANQLDSLTKQDGKFWESPPGPNIPKFRPHAGHRAEIIAVTNLKGGVGKTTISANLGATFWAMDKRVLLVDLDYQRTLTNLCVDALKLNQIDVSRRYVDRLFREAPVADHVACGLWTHLDRQGYLVAAREELAEVEEHVKAQWLLKQTKFDARFVLRQILHSPAIQDQFDFIILDCPPRLTLASINALTSCDRVLIPVVPDKASTKAVPRLIGWLKKLKYAGVAPNLDLLGIVGNLTHFANKFSRREQNNMNELVKECELHWPEQPYLFAQGIPRKAAFAEATESKKLAAFEPALAPLFQKLVKEMNRRFLPHESQPATKVS